MYASLVRSGGSVLKPSRTLRGSPAGAARTTVGPTPVAPGLPSPEQPPRRRQAPSRDTVTIHNAGLGREWPGVAMRGLFLGAVVLGLMVGVAVAGLRIVMGGSDSSPE